MVQVPCQNSFGKAVEGVQLDPRCALTGVKCTSVLTFCFRTDFLCSMDKLKYTQNFLYVLKEKKKERKKTKTDSTSK